jgi:hypothetical protein
MPKRISLEPYLGLAELENRYRQSKDVIARTHFQTIWLLALAKTTELFWQWIKLDGTLAIN